MPEVKTGGMIRPGTPQASTILQNGLLVRSPSIIYDRFDFEAPVEIYASTVKSSRMGAFSYCGLKTTICDADIGRYCSIGEGVYVGLGIHRTNALTTSPALGSKTFDWHSRLKKPFETSSFRPVHIGHDVWIGTQAIVMGGVSVGHGAVIGAGSVVTKDISPYTIVAGNPARPIKTRFPEPMIERLLCVQPWKYDLRSAYDGDGDLSDELTDPLMDRLEKRIALGRMVEWPTDYARLEPLDDDRWRLSRVRN